MEYIVYYENQQSYTDIKRYSDVNLSIIKEAKLKRLGLGSDNINKVRLGRYKIYLIQIFMEFILTHVT